MWITRVFSSLVFLAAIILSIPLAFDVGGRSCGLAYSLALSTFYFFYSVLRIATPSHARIRNLLVNLVALTQWVVLPSLLLWAVGRFGVEAEKTRSWKDWTFSGQRTPETSLVEWLFGAGGVVENVTLGTWDKTLRWSTPVFQLCEGFCSLLVIQAAGQITRWVVNRTSRSDGWMIAFLVLSASIISSSIYFLWRIAKFPEIDNIDAILIGMTITSVTILGAWGIGSGRGNPVESSLLFAYIVLCIYQIFTDYQPSNPKTSGTDPASAAAALPPLPPIIMDSVSTLRAALSTLPSMVHPGFHFVAAALATITPSVLVSLAYRVAVLYASTRIIPAVRGAGARALSEEASLEDADGAGQILALLSWFSPSILIAVYTSLLMQHFARTSSGLGIAGIHAEFAPRAHIEGVGANLWKWINVAGTMALYALELHLGKEDVDGGVTGHWKAD